MPPLSVPPDDGTAAALFVLAFFVAPVLLERALLAGQNEPPEQGPFRRLRHPTTRTSTEGVLQP